MMCRSFQDCLLMIYMQALLTLALLFTHHHSGHEYILLAFNQKLNTALDRASKDKVGPKNIDFWSSFVIFLSG